MPIVVQDHKEGIAPSPGIVVPEGPDGLQGVFVSRIKPIRCGGGVIKVAGFLGSDSDLVSNVRLIEIEQGGLLVIPVE